MLPSRHRLLYPAIAVSFEVFPCFIADGFARCLTFTA